MSYNPLPQPADVIVISAGSSVTEVNRFPVGIGSTGFVSLKQGAAPISFSNPLPVSLGSSNITITGDVNVGTTVSVTSTPQDPVHTHITEVGSSGILQDMGIPYMPVGISSLLNTVSIGNTVSISNTSFYITNPVTTVAVSGIGSTVTVQGTVGIGTTGQVSLNLNSAPVSSSNPLPVTGTVSISTSSAAASVTFPPIATDAFGRLRTSTPLTLFDSSHRYRDNNLWSSLVVGTGSTVGFVTAQGLVQIGIGTTAGCSAIRETSKVFPYQPGKSLQVMSTFVMNSPKTNLRQRIGYFGADNGMYLELDGSTLYFVERSLSTGTTTRVAQSDWNVDTMLGVGHLNPSGITLDISKAQILWMDIEWLGLGTVRLGFVVDGKFIHCHSFHHANLITSTYITTASLPVRYEIANTGITTSVSNLKQVCSTVISEGGYELRGLQQAVGTAITAPRTLTTAGTFYPIVSLRLKTTALDAIVIMTALSLMGIGNGINYNWQVRASGITSGGSWVSAGADSGVEYNITGTSYAGGRTLASGFLNSSNQGSPSIDILKEALFKFQLERNGLTSTPYELTLVVTAATGSEQIFASMDWEEISR
jgi:hypothetical protein